MDYLSFTVEMTKALAWPILCAFAIYLLRTPLIGLIPFVEELKFKDFSLKFRQKIEDARHDIEKRSSETLSTPEASNERDILSRLAKLSPRGAILEAWLFLENELLALSVQRGLTSDKSSFHGNSRIGHAMLELKAFDKEDFQLFHDLKKLRNEAAHVPDFALSPADAVGYVTVATKLAERARAKSAST